MIFKVKIVTIYECSLERAFKTPLLCDVSKIHTGFGLMPRITHVSDDENWGKSGSSKKVYAAKSLMQKGSFVSMDSIIERAENKYWKFQVDQFQSWMLGFYKFVIEWKTTELEPNKILVEYTFWLHSNSAFLFPFNWLFANAFWKAYMKQVVENVRQLAYKKEPYQYE
jgi:hypothetical protein